MSNSITFVGLDVHKETIVAAVLLPRRQKPEVLKIAHDSAAIARLVRKLRGLSAGQLRCCYEAGPTGFHLQRTLEGMGVPCIVIAPSMIPAKPGDRIKTDRRDALKLAQLLRAELLTEVRPPTEAEEAVRDLCRAREHATKDSTSAKLRLTKFLLRRGLHCDSSTWTRPWWAWVRALKLAYEADQIVLEHYVLAVDQAELRTASLTTQIERFSQQSPYADTVARLRCFRGIDTCTAMTLVTELHGFARFTSPRQLMGYLGLVPSEHSSGSSQRRGSITKAGNGHVRRALVEAAWHYRLHPRVGKKLTARRRGQPASVIAAADHAMHRLYKRWTSMVMRDKPTCKATTAVARELAGFVWATMMEVQRQQS